MGSLVDQGLAARERRSHSSRILKVITVQYSQELYVSLCCSWLITDSNSDEFYSSISGSEESGSEEESTSGSGRDQLIVYRYEY